MKRQLHLNLFIHSRGHHEASWRHPAASPLPLTDIRYYQDLAQRAEAGCSIRSSSPTSSRSATTWRRRRAPGSSRSPCWRRWRRSTSRIGLIATASTTYTEPFNLARQFALARPHQQRPRRLEHRHLVAGDGGAQFRRRRPGEPRRPLRPRRGVHGGRQGAVGQLGRRRGARRPRRRALRPGRPHPADQSRGRALPGGRAAQHAAHARRAGRCSCRPARPTPAAASPRATPRRCSPRTWRRRRRRNSTPT